MKPEHSILLHEFQTLLEKHKAKPEVVLLIKEFAKQTIGFSQAQVELTDQFISYKGEIIRIPNGWKLKFPHPMPLGLQDCYIGYNHSGKCWNASPYKIVSDDHIEAEGVTSLMGRHRFIIIQK